MDENQIPVLFARFKIPSPRNNYVVRKALQKKLNQMKQNKVTIIKAGAGSGKTTLLSVYLRENKEINKSWLTLDQSLNQVILFWRYFLQAVEAYLSSQDNSLQNCFDGNMQKEMLEKMIPLLVENLSKVKDYYLILDDFQVIDDSYLLQTLDSFIDIMPEGMHLIILSRTMPEINTGSLFMEGNLLLVEETEMRCSHEECGEFIRNTLAVNFTEDEINQIIDNANGWIGGAQLMAIAFRHEGKASQVYASASEQVIFDYIKKEIYDELSQEEQLFLKKTAILSYFNKEICERYLPEYSFSHMMQLILEKNLFVIHIDEEKQEYRYHAILREFLLHEVNENTDRKKQLLNRAAEVFFDIKDYDECTRLLFESENYLTLMEKLMQMPQNVVTFSHMMQVPLEQIAYNANFAYQYFFCYYAGMELEECRKIYEFISNNLKDKKTFSAFKYVDMFFDVNWEFKEIPIMSSEQIEHMPLNEITKAYLYVKEAYFLFLADKIKDAMAYLNQADLIQQKTSNIYIHILILLEKTQILEEYGEFEEALQYYREMKPFLEKVPAMRVTYYIGIAGLHIRQLKLAEAKEELVMGKELLDSNVPSVKNAFLYTLAEWHYIMGNIQKTQDIILNLVKDKMYQSIFYMARLLRYRVKLDGDDKLEEAYIDGYENSSDLVKNMDAELLYDSLIYERRDKLRGMEMVDSLVATARKSGNKLKIVEGSLMKMRFLIEQEQDPLRIRNLLIEAVTYAYPENLRTPFWLESKCLKCIWKEQKEKLQKLLSKEQYIFLEEIINNANSFSYQQKTNPLSAREREVLEEMAGGFTNKEIANHLCISLATVKTHIINIYGKLEVNNRVEAVSYLEKEKK